MDELVMVGFSDKFRAIEALSQLQRLNFDWSEEIRTAAAAVEVEEDGQLKLIYGQLLNPVPETREALRWKALLNAILPMPHAESEAADESLVEGWPLHNETRKWLSQLSLDREFARNAAALLRPGNSAIIAFFRNATEAVTVLHGYSPLLLRTRVENGRLVDKYFP